MLMCPVLVLKFNFRFLINDAEREENLMTSFIYLFSLVLYDLECVRKVVFIPLRTFFNCVNVSSTCLEIQFQVFNQ